MRTTTDPITGIVLHYPDEVCFAFNPVMVRAENATELRVFIMDGVTPVYTINATALGGECYLDIQEYCQSMFDPMVFGVDYSQTKEITPQGETLSFMVEADVGNDTYNFTFLSFVVWGALKSCGEDFREMRTVTWFKNFPWVYSVFLQGGTNILFSYNNQPNWADSILTTGIYNFNPSTLQDGARYWVIYEYNGVLQQATFDTTFDLTFWLDNGGSQLAILRIDFDADADEGYYLRWIDRRGYWMHWLFKGGDEQRAVAAIREFQRNALVNYDLGWGWRRGSGRRQAMSRADIVPLCAPLVNSQTFDILQDVTTSPIVELYCGDDGNNDPVWVDVGVQAATYTKNRDDLQDFAMNLILPEIPIQSL